MADDTVAASSQPRPEWLVSNFDSVEAQAQAYAEARTEMGRAQAAARDWESHAASLEERLSELEAAQMEPEPQQAPELPFNPLAAQLQQARYTDDLQTEMALTAYMASQIAEQKIAEALKQQQPQNEGPDPAQYEMFAMWADNTARERYDQRYGPGEYDQVRQDAAMYLSANPDLLPENSTPSQVAQRLVMAAEYVQGQKYLTASETERNQMALTRQQRLMAQTMTSGGASPPTADDAEARWEAIRNAPSGSYGELRGRG